MERRAVYLLRLQGQSVARTGAGLMRDIIVTIAHALATIIFCIFLGWLAGKLKMMRVEHARQCRERRHVQLPSGRFPD
jgi:hypothetical protein